MAPKRKREKGEKQRLTDAIVRRHPLPKQGKAITVDADVPGFGATGNLHARRVDGMSCPEM